MKPEDIIKKIEQELNISPTRMVGDTNKDIIYLVVNDEEKKYELEPSTEESLDELILKIKLEMEGDK